MPAQPTLPGLEQIVVYSNRVCTACANTYRKLDALGVPYAVRYLEEEPEEVAAAFRADGHRQAPVVTGPFPSFSGFRPDLLEDVVAPLFGRGR